MSQSIETRFLESRTPKLAFDIRAGAEPTLLCVHGNSSHRGLWGPLLRRLSDHAALRLDLRGHGESDWAFPPAYSTADYADDIRAAAETLGGREFVLVSHSNGSLASIYDNRRDRDQQLVLAYKLHKPCKPFFQSSLRC